MIESMERKIEDVISDVTEKTEVKHVKEKLEEIRSYVKDVNLGVRGLIEKRESYWLNLKGIRTGVTEDVDKSVQEVGDESEKVADITATENDDLSESTSSTQRLKGKPAL